MFDLFNESRCVLIGKRSAQKYTVNYACVHLGYVDQKKCGHMQALTPVKRRDQRPSYSGSYAMEAASSQHTCYYRSGYDISVGLWPKVAYHELQSTPPDHRRYFLTFRVSARLQDVYHRLDAELTDKPSEGWDLTDSRRGTVAECASHNASSVFFRRLPRCLNGVGAVLGAPPISFDYTFYRCIAGGCNAFDLGVSCVPA